MKAQIEEFEIDVDVTDRVTLYDYATCRYVQGSKQEHGRWRESIAHLGGTEHIDKHDENMMMQVRARLYKNINMEDVAEDITSYSQTPQLI